MDSNYAKYDYSIAAQYARAAPEQQSMDNSNAQVPTVIGSSFDPEAGQSGGGMVTQTPTYHISMDLDSDIVATGFPPELKDAGMTEVTWGVIVKAVEDGKRDNPFHNCPMCECIFWCFPLLCLQCVLCLMLNPCAWWAAMKTNRGVRSAAETVSQQLKRSNPQWDCNAELGATRNYIVLSARARDGPPCL